MGRLNLQGPLYETSGYASAARGFFMALHAHTDLPLRLTPLRWNSGAPACLDQKTYLTLQDYAQQPAAAEDTLLHWSIAPEFQGRQGHRRAIGHAIFETHSLPQQFVAGCNRMDAVIVPTPFHEQSFREAGVEVPIAVIPEGVDTDRFQPIGPTLSTVPERFTFLCIAQITYRKGLDLVISAFLDLFQHHDDVQLVLRCYLKDSSPQDMAKVAQVVKTLRKEKKADKGHIFLLENVPDPHLPALYRSAHVLVAPFRGEGWGLPITEALASELPVIATGWGGPMSYLSEDIAYLLPYDLKPIPDDIPDYFLGGPLLAARQEKHLLAEPHLDALRYAMWDAYQNYFLHKARASAGRQHLHQHFRWEHAAQRFAHWLAKGV